MTLSLSKDRCVAECSRNTVLPDDPFDSPLDSGSKLERTERFDSSDSSQ